LQRRGCEEVTENEPFDKRHFAESNEALSMSSDSNATSAAWRATFAQRLIDSLWTGELERQAEIRRRADAIFRDVDELRTNTPLVGTPTEIVDRLAPFAEAGVQRVYLQVLDIADLDHLELFANEVIGQLR